MYKQILIVGLIFCLNVTVHANRVGNGGNVVSCLKEGKEGLQLLDLYESNLNLRKFVDKAEAFAIAQVAFESFKKFDQKISQQYLKSLQQIKSDIEYKSDIEIQSSNDAKIKELPVGCKLIQIALRKNALTSIEQKFIFSKTYWEKLAPTDQAGLLIHEIIYDHFYKLGEEDSLKARKLVAYLMSEKIDQDSSEEVRNFIRSLKVPLYRSP